MAEWHALWPWSRSHTAEQEPLNTQTETRDLPSEGGVATRAQHRGRPSGRPRSSRGLWGGFEELCSETPGGGAAPQADKKAPAPQEAVREAGNSREGVIFKLRGKILASEPGRIFKSASKAMRQQELTVFSHKPRNARAKPEEFRGGEHRGRPSGRPRSAAGMWGEEPGLLPATRGAGPPP